MALSPEERARVRRALGWPNVSPGSALTYGTPMNSPMLTIVERRMDDLTVEGEGLLREDIDHYEATRLQIRTANTRLKAESIKDVKTNVNEIGVLRDQLKFWSNRIADDLGVSPNPNKWTEDSGGINARVR